MNIAIISLISIFQRQNSLLSTLKSCFQQSLNSKYYLDKDIINLSEEPYLLDTGFKDKKITNIELIQFINKNKQKILINWTLNTGPYRNFFIHYKNIGIYQNK